MRRLMLPSALLYESIEDFRFDVASVICSSPLNIFLVTFPEQINDNRNTSKMWEINYLGFQKELNRGGYEMPNIPYMQYERQWLG